jgi:ribosome-interacting GTPase 1
MGDETPEEELARLRAENESLKKKKGGGELSFKVSQKGAVSVYGMGRFPVTLYKEQWLRLLDRKDDILEFIKENEDSLTTKE